MTDRPIIFSGPMVRALLDGRKTMTRRLAWRTKMNDGGVIYDGGGGQMDYVEPHEERVGPTSWQKTKPGDLLWVREAFAPGYIYRADGEKQPGACCGCLWRPSIHMPRLASRLTLRVTAVKTERLQDISYEDAIAEGMPDFTQFRSWDHVEHDEPLEDCARRLQWPQRWFSCLWHDLHGRGSWEANPWVVAISFDVIKANIDSPAVAAEREKRRRVA